MSAASNQKMEKSTTTMADRSCRKCGKVDYKQLNSVYSVVLYDSAPSASRRKKGKPYEVERIISTRRVRRVSICFPLRRVFVKATCIRGLIFTF